MKDLENGRDKGFFTENLDYHFSRKEQHKDYDGAVLEFFYINQNPRDHRMVWTANLLHEMQLPDLLGDKWINDTTCKRLTVQTILCSLKFLIHQSLKHDTLSHLARSWTYSTQYKKN